MRVLAFVPKTPIISVNSVDLRSISSVNRRYLPMTCLKPSRPRCVIHWFRRDLRLQDNRALRQALSHAAEHRISLHPIFIFDAHSHARSRCGSVRLRFILECLTNLRDSLRKHGLHLHVLRSSTDVASTLRRCAGAANATHVFAQRGYDGRSRELEHALLSSAQSGQVTFEFVDDFTLCPPEQLIKAAGGIERVPTSMRAFIALFDNCSRFTVEQPGSFPADVATAVVARNGSHHDRQGEGRIMNPFGSLEDVELFKAVPSVQEIETSLAMAGGGNDTQHEPCAEELALRKRIAALSPAVIAAGYIKGGESEALNRMHTFLKRDNGRTAREFSKPLTSPAAFDPRDTTGLSAHLAMGSLSPRTLYYALLPASPRKKLQVQTSLRGQLLWREHFWLLCYTQAHFEENVDENKLCRPIAWSSVDGDNDFETYKRKWTYGATGYPWIDALITQLHVSGFIHHLGRHSVACFLTRGDLWLPWTVGQQVFQRLLIDHDHALNAANWMWLSCSAFFSMYNRVYSPVAFAKKWDKDGNFVRAFVPEIAGLPTEYVHEPWKAPRSVQRRANCGVETASSAEEGGLGDQGQPWIYPKRIVVHEDIVKVNRERMKREFARFKDERKQGNLKRKKTVHDADDNGTDGHGNLVRSQTKKTKSQRGLKDTKQA